MKLLVIPARGGSKRIPRKNIKHFAGKPIIQWSIETGLQTNYYDKIVVSTDDYEIKSIAESLGASVPFIRPKKLADDYTSTSDVVKHAINWYQSKGYEMSIITCLYATSPFTNFSDLKKAINLYENSKDKSGFIFSASIFPSPIQRAMYITEEGCSKMFNPENYSLRTQDLEKAYYDAGQFYIGSSDSWLNKTNIFENSQPLILSPWKVKDIDTFEDWEMAEKLFKINN